MDKQFGEKLFELLAQVLNSPANREVLDTIRGEYGLMWYIYQAGEPVSVKTLVEHLHVVPGRMTDILKSLEKKNMIRRIRNDEDKRMVFVELLEEGKREVQNRRWYIAEKFQGLDQIFSEEEQKELLYLLKMLLTYQE